jgi:hypothetical protein
MTDPLKTDQELIHRWTNTSFFRVKDIFIENSICNSEEGLQTLSGIFLKYEFFVGKRSVGDFLITE